jgi:hypothetical protein
MTRAQREARFAAVCRDVLGHPSALAFVAEFIAKAGVLHTPHRGEATHDTAFACGRQALGLEMLGALKAVHPGALAALDAAMLPIPQEAPRE